MQSALKNFNANRLNRLQGKGLVQYFFGFDRVEVQAGFYPILAQLGNAGTGVLAGLDWVHGFFEGALNQRILAVVDQGLPEVHRPADAQSFCLPCNKPFDHLDVVRGVKPVPSQGAAGFGQVITAFPCPQ